MGEEQRLRSLDVFRGLTIAGMIVVNSPGNDAGYSFLNHSPWNGWTLADLIFPFFLIIMGIAIPFSFSKHLESGGTDGTLFWKILRRSVILFAIGLPGGVSLDANGLFRIPGVLQRIAICYGASSAAYLKTSPKTLILIIGGLLLGYWLLLTQVPVPGFGKGNLSIQGNLASYLDRLILGRHLYTDIHDPEGILSTFPALGTTLMGVLTGIWLRSGNTEARKTTGMLGAGAVLALFGWIWGIWFPINKQIWTSSFALFTGGLGLCLFSFCYWSIDIRGHKVWGKPFEVLGVNAITAYCLASLSYALQELWKIPRIASDPKTFHMYLSYRLFSPWLSLKAASAAFAVSHMIAWMAIMAILYRKKVFLKV